METDSRETDRGRTERRRTGDGRDEGVKWGKCGLSQEIRLSKLRKLSVTYFQLCSVIDFLCERDLDRLGEAVAWRQTAGRRTEDGQRGDGQGTDVTRETNRDSVDSAPRFA